MTRSAIKQCLRFICFQSQGIALDNQMKYTKNTGPFFSVPFRVATQRVGLADLWSKV